MYRTIHYSTAVALIFPLQQRFSLPFGRPGLWWPTVYCIHTLPLPAPAHFYFPLHIPPFVHACLIPAYSRRDWGDVPFTCGFCSAYTVLLLSTTGEPSLFMDVAGHFITISCLPHRGLPDLSSGRTWLPITLLTSPERISSCEPIHRYRCGAV